ncbi:MAG TPA: class I SAM-dependent methyltransferase [Elusimicrobiota bacterium]|nr:class I SAM-dependent methyltransferase [Elusimicrobiota bacterium]
MLDRRRHWEAIYGDRKPEEVSWFQESPALSLELIREAAPSKDSRIIDVGGGASRLVDFLTADHFSAVTVLDVSGRALAYSSERLGPRAKDVAWIESDVFSFAPSAPYEVWHDRAVFHFLTEKAERDAYLQVLRRALKPGGAVILAAFASDGPEKCSGLPVRRYDAGLVREAFGGDFELVRETAETHVTPWKAEQRFSYYRLMRN